MPKRKRQTTLYSDSDPEELDSNYECGIFIPDPEDSGDDISENELDDESSSEENDNLFQNVTFEKIYENYSESQKKLEPEYVYDWNSGESIYTDTLNDELLLSDSIKKKIQNSTPVELFELYFSNEFKHHVIDATKSNGYDLSYNDFDTFVGILIVSSYNIRMNLRDYWSQDPKLNCPAIKNAMSRNKFLEIKRKIKYSKYDEYNDSDRAWKVRKMINIFRKNIQQFGFFSTALSIDEMMVKFFGRTVLKQFMRQKPIRFGIKLWAICTSSGYLLDFDIYCGKNSFGIGEKLKSISLGSRVVMQMLHQLLNSTNIKKLHKYHIYVDNFFMSVDLVVHLKKIGLRITGTVRKDRVGTIKNKLSLGKNAVRGEYQVQNEKNSSMNYVLVKDNKDVMLLSTAAGVTPTSSIQRFSKEKKVKCSHEFPNIIAVYNKYMGGVDLHDYRCNRVAPSIGSKKWTWTIFCRMIQSALTNATILRNLCDGKNKKISSKDIAISVSNHYLNKAKSTELFEHKKESKQRGSCATTSCPQRTTNFCVDCNLYFCLFCFEKIHASK